ncbi:MAG: TetR family transcriptional regulator [Acetobacteraceae bacterium]|nr:TetR family transcriptional regulator [Acetobacteraceae bacterium]
MLHLLPVAQRAPLPAPANQPGRGLAFGARPTRKALDRRQRLREAGAALFATQGLENTPIHQIAHAAGVSFRTARDDYPSRAALLHDFLHAHLDAVMEAVGTADERHANAEPAARLSAVILALFATLRVNRHAHALLVPGLPSLAGPAREDITHARRLVTFRLYTIIEAAVPRLAAARELRAPVTRLLLAALGDAAQWFRDDGALAREDYAALLARLLIDGAKSAIAQHRGSPSPLP